jgi:hypothetical protein
VSTATITEWIGRLATNLLDPKGRIEALMYDLGGFVIQPSTERDPRSVWVTDDHAPNGRAGYYTKHYAPIPHHIATDGVEVVVEFTYKGTSYLIRSRSASTIDGNMRLIALMLESCAQFVSYGFLRWEDAFLPFLKSTGEQAQEGEPALREEWWRVLRLPPDATPEEIEAAYRAQVRKHHPDAGGSHEGFLRVQAAYKAAKERS